MKRILFFSLCLSLFLYGCGIFKVSVIESGSFIIDNNRIYGGENVLIIVGEGGTSGNMFIKAANTYREENGGDLYEVRSGDEFISAVNDFIEKKGEIVHLEYFGHGNDVGLYVNQAPNVNGGVYANDPSQNEGYLAASIFELNNDIFSDSGWIKFNGCNVANGYPEKDNLAQRISNYFDIDVVAPMGPTEFSSSPYFVNPIPNSNYLNPDFDGEVYMVPTYGDQGFVVVRPQNQGKSGYKDVREGQFFEEAVFEMEKRGLNLGGGDRFLPYYNITYADAVEFCRVALKDISFCGFSGYENGQKMRNLAALAMLVDAYGVELSTSNPWYDSYIYWANNEGLLTEDFVNKKWYTRGEMAQLTWNFIKKFEN